MQLLGDPWAEDPGCYLTNAEIGLDSTAVHDRVDPHVLMQQHPVRFVRSKLHQGVKTYD